MEIPQFNTNKELFDFLTENKSLLVAQKKATIKQADTVGFYPLIEDSKGVDLTVKANTPIENAPDVIKTKIVINTPNLMDSHKDVHIPGIWNKSVSENKNIMHLQEHQMAFDKIISSGEDVRAYVKSYSWGEIGQKYSGNTEALIFESNIRKDRNAFMHEQYSKGFVTNHSVGMQYVKMHLAINDESYNDEFATWEKYIKFVSNKEQAEAVGYFWAVTEAKVIEGSAVPIGSNQATPTLENNMKFEPLENTQKEHRAAQSTQSLNRRLL